MRITIRQADRLADTKKVRVGGELGWGGGGRGREEGPEKEVEEGGGEGGEGETRAEEERLEKEDEEGRGEGAERYIEK